MRYIEKIIITNFNFLTWYDFGINNKKNIDIRWRFFFSLNSQQNINNN